MSITTVIKWAVSLNGFSLARSKNLSVRYLFGFLVRERERVDGPESKAQNLGENSVTDVRRQSQCLGRSEFRV